MAFEQLGLLDFTDDNYKIETPVRIIEFFAGIGSQAKALEILGVPFENWKTCEWSKESIKAYKQIHHHDEHIEIDLTKEQLIEKVRGISSNYNEAMTDKQLSRLSLDELKFIHECNLINHNLINISDVKGSDLDIVDTNKYTYLLSYSFPCQDLSLAGKGAGLEEGSETRSSLLWEVGRILKECCGYPILTLDEEKFIEEKEMSYEEYFEMKNIKFDIDKSKLPQILVMENVDMILSVKFKKHFFRWCKQLEDMGYANFYEVLNAKDYGIPQNRKRCFMVSILGKGNTYAFPNKMTLEYKLKDFLEKQVDEKYYLSEKMIAYLTKEGTGNYDRKEVFMRNLDPKKEVAATICTAPGQRAVDNYIVDGDIKIIDTYNKCYPHDQEAIGTIPAGYNRNQGCVIEEVIPIRENTEKGYSEAADGDGIYISHPEQKRGVVQKGSIPTLKANNGDIGVVVKDDYVGTFEYNKSDQFMGKNDRFEESSEVITPIMTNGRNKAIVEKTLFTEEQADMINKDGNIKRYIDSDKVDEFKEGQVADISFPNGYNKAKRTHDECPTINTTTTESSFITKETQTPLRIRKLTPCECYKLMGFTPLDYERCKEVQSNSRIYHQSGDSIVTTVLVAIFGKLFGADYENIIRKYIRSEILQ